MSPNPSPEIVIVLGWSFEIVAGVIAVTLGADSRDGVAVAVGDGVAVGVADGILVGVADGVVVARGGAGVGVAVTVAPGIAVAVDVSAEGGLRGGTVALGVGVEVGVGVDASAVRVAVGTLVEVDPRVGVTAVCVGVGVGVGASRVGVGRSAVPVAGICVAVGVGVLVGLAGGVAWTGVPRGRWSVGEAGEGARAKATDGVADSCSISHTAQTLSRAAARDKRICLIGSVLHDPDLCASDAPPEPRRTTRFAGQWRRARGSNLEDPREDRRRSQPSRRAVDATNVGGSIYPWMGACKAHGRPHAHGRGFCRPVTVRWKCHPMGEC